ncbi:Ribosomal RNA large subunit methyltransferase G [Folsomia candida]|uniref:Ribosomal RNA large subunit methyltransferase G n=1 Tax=Folsomia candida TaxID=158441 RepID=A0A226D5I2_FOLCA|nr:Ribosomal RNA large subunit methyltransferase G [Folsomia candida]
MVFKKQVVLALAATCLVFLALHQQCNARPECIVKCVMGKIGLMDNSSMVSTATVQNFMTTMDIPEEAHDLGHFLAEDCVNEHASKLDPAQPFCESYGDFTMCMQTVFGNFAEKANCQPNLPG